MTNATRCLHYVLAVAGLIVLVATAACSGPAQTTSATSAATNPPAAATFADPFAYCASVRNVDRPDSRYVGVSVPDSVINGYLQAAGLTSSTEPMDQLRRSTLWRCMDGNVYVCSVGANLPCDSKADTNTTPSAAMEYYCTTNPDSDFIPMSVTGHTTVYNWYCANTSPQTNGQIDQVDPRGFLKRIWYPIQPSP